MRLALWLSTATLTALCVSAPAEAQQQPAPASGPVVRDGKTIYDAAYFAQYAPRTAYDIVQHVPGFQLDLGSTQSATGSVDVRGFAGTAGNVVFNGSRPSTKSETLDTTLQRIPAQRVVRVEVSSGDIYGSDYAGKSQVLNVVMSEAGGFDANVTADLNRRYTGYVQPNLSGNVLIRKGPSSINLSAGNQLNKQFEEGTDTLTNLTTGDLVEFRRKHNVYANRDPFIAGAYALERGASDAYRFNFRWQPSTFDLKQRNRITPSNGPAHDDSLLQNYNDPRIEFGGDVTRPLGGGAIKFVALETRRKRHDLDRYTQRSGLLDEPATVVNGGFEQLINAQRNETIGRVSWTKANVFGLSFETGAEGSYNTLKNNTRFSQVDENGEKVPIPLPIADAMVKEWRGEAYFSAGKTLSSNLRIDGGLNYEFSHLTVTGDATEDRKLRFFKPNLTLDWKPGGGWHTQVSIRRTVAQLDFYDFISSADLSAQRVNGGNAQLQPQRSWELRATVDRPILGDGLIKLDFGHDQVSLLQDRILICDPEHPDNAALCFDAPGKIGTGKRDFAQLTFDLPMSRLWSGLRIKGGGTLQRTRVEDPINHEMRKWSGYYPSWQWNVDVRRDSGQWSYGFSVNDNQRFTFYRTDEFDTNFNGAPYWTSFIEYRPWANTSISLNFDNIAETSGNRQRTLFRPNRADPVNVFDEVRERNRHQSVGITLKRSFGGGGGPQVAKSN
jgi:hypothetical protein